MDVWMILAMFAISFAVCLPVYFLMDAAEGKRTK